MLKGLLGQFPQGVCVCVVCACVTFQEHFIEMKDLEIFVSPALVFFFVDSYYIYVQSLLMLNIFVLSEL